MKNKPIIASIYDHPLVTTEHWENFTSEEHDRWSRLFRRQNELLKNRAAPEVMDGMNLLHICEDQIPRFSDLNQILQKSTGFSVIAVKGLIPEDLFFQFLAERKFPSTCFIREEDQIDYLEEPDIFHDVYGHIPLLVNPVFADFMEAFGHKGLEAIDKGFYKYVSALYWFTVEFGLIQTNKGLRIYGSGITSSKGESIYSLESEKPIRTWFDPIIAMKTEYRIDDYQKNYFVIKDYTELFSTLRDLNWDQIKDQLLDGKNHKAGVAADLKQLLRGKNGK